MICLQLQNVAGPCAKCREYQMNGIHLIDERMISCAKCCPCCRQASIDWSTDAPVTVEQTQGVMFQ